MLYIFDVAKRSHRANKFTDNKFIYRTHSTPVLTECSWDHFVFNYPTPRTWATCVKIYRSKVHPILTLVVKFKLNPTSVAQVRAPPPAVDTICSPLSNRENLQRWCVDMWVGLVGAAPTPSPTYFWTNQGPT